MGSSFINNSLEKNVFLLGNLDSEYSSRMYQNYIKSKLIEENSVPPNITDWELEKPVIRLKMMEKYQVQNIFTSPPALNIIHHDTIDREKYFLIRISYSITTELRIPALLYVPKSIGKKPAVIYSEGNFWENDVYHIGNFQWQSFCQRMALNGYIVLSIASFGDYPNYDTNFEYPWLWNLAFLGDWLPKYKCILPQLQGVNLLLTREDVYEDKIGITGASWGGYSTHYSMMLDDRIKVGVSVVSQHVIVDDFVRRESGHIHYDEMPSGLYPEINENLTYKLSAPKPFLFITSTTDLEDAQVEYEKDVLKIFNQGKQLYSLYNNEDALNYYVEPLHNYDQSKREKAYAWFDYWLKGDSTVTDPNVPITEEIDSLIPSSNFYIDSFKNFKSKTLKGVYDDLMSSEKLVKIKALIIPENNNILALKDYYYKYFKIDTLIETPSLEFLSEEENDTLISKYYFYTPSTGIKLPVISIKGKNSKRDKKILLIGEDSEGRFALSENEDSRSIIDTLLANGYEVITLDLFGTGSLKDQNYYGWPSPVPYFRIGAFSEGIKTVGKSFWGLNSTYVIGLSGLLVDKAQTIDLITFGTFSSLIGSLSKAFGSKIKSQTTLNILPSFDEFLKSYSLDAQYDWLLLSQFGIYQYADVSTILETGMEKPLFIGNSINKDHITYSPTQTASKLSNLTFYPKFKIFNSPQASLYTLPEAIVFNLKKQEMLTSFKTSIDTLNKQEYNFGKVQFDNPEIVKKVIVAYPLWLTTEKDSISGFFKSEYETDPQIIFNVILLDGDTVEIIKKVVICENCTRNSALLSSYPDNFAYTNISYSYIVSLTNPNLYPVEFKLIESPSWLMLDENGRLFGRPSENFIGDNRVTFQVKQGLMVIVSYSFIISVVAPESETWEVNNLTPEDGDMIYGGLKEERFSWESSNSLPGDEYVLRVYNHEFDSSYYASTNFIILNPSSWKPNIYSWNLYLIRNFKIYKSKLNYKFKVDLQDNHFVPAVYPNPFKDELYTKFYLTSKSKTVISIFDSQGSKVKELSFFLSKGSTTLPINLYGLPKGIYFLNYHIIPEDIQKEVYFKGIKIICNK